MKRIVLLLLTVSITWITDAQILITDSSLYYTQNFDGLDTITSTANASSKLPVGWSVFEFAGNSSAGSRVDQKYLANNGSSSTGDTYSYGTTGSLERALGSVVSSSISTQYGARFVNNTGGTITSFTIRYRGEQWRMGATGRANKDSLRF